jgi:hypothetical protein
MVIIKVFCDKLNCIDNNDGECRAFQTSLKSVLPNKCFTEDEIWNGDKWINKICNK